MNKMYLKLIFAFATAFTFITADAQVFTDAPCSSSGYGSTVPRSITVMRYPNASTYYTIVDKGVPWLFFYENMKGYSIQCPAPSPNMTQWSTFYLTGSHAFSNGGDWGHMGWMLRAKVDGGGFAGMGPIFAPAATTTSTIPGVRGEIFGDVYAIGYCQKDSSQALSSCPTEPPALADANPSLPTLVDDHQYLVGTQADRNGMSYYVEDLVTHETAGGYIPNNNQSEIFGPLGGIAAFFIGEFPLATGGSVTLSDISTGWFITP